MGILLLSKIDYSRLGLRVLSCWYVCMWRSSWGGCQRSGAAMAHSPIKGPQKNNRGEAEGLFLWYLKVTGMVSVSTFIPMFDELGTNMAGSSFTCQPFGLQGFMLIAQSFSVCDWVWCVSTGFLGLLYSGYSVFCVPDYDALSHPSSNCKDPACGWFYYPPLSLYTVCMHSFREVWSSLRGGIVFLLYVQYSTTSGKVYQIVRIVSRYKLR